MSRAINELRSDMVQKGSIAHFTLGQPQDPLAEACELLPAANPQLAQARLSDFFELCDAACQ